MIKFGMLAMLSFNCLK